jgi:hypothetical protein
MIPIPNDFDNARAYDGNSIPPLSLGGHVCRVHSARVEKTRNGTDQLIVEYDVYEDGEFNRYYNRRFEAAKAYRPDTKWPGVFRANLLTRDGATNGYFKGFITALEQSNTGYSFKATNGNEAAMRGLYVGFAFGEREFKTDKGEIKTVVEPFYAVSVAKVREGVPIPAKKVLRDTATAQGFNPVDDDDLPF